MRFVYIALIAILGSLVLLFKVQNLDAVTVSILTMSLTLPVSVLILLVYVLGMFTGGFMVALVRSWIRGATTRPQR